VNTLNSLSGAVTLTGGTNVSLVPSGNNITINATAGAGGVSSVEGQSGAVDFTSTDGTVSFTASAGTIDFSASGGGGVTSINTLVGNLDLVSTDGSVTIGSAGTAIDLSIPAGHAVVNSIDGITGAITFSSLDNTVFFDPAGTNIDFKAIPIIRNGVYLPSPNPILNTPPFPTVNQDIEICSQNILGAGPNIIDNLAYASVITVNVSLGPIASQSPNPSGSFLTFYGLCSGGSGTHVKTANMGIVVLPTPGTFNNNTDFCITFYKARNEFFNDTTTISIWSTLLPTAPFSDIWSMQSPFAILNITAW
jgi:hypothetical protein